MAAGRQVTRAQFDEAKVHRLNLGKHKGLTYDQVAETDEGLLYLGWLNGQAWYGDDSHPNNEKRKADLETFLGYTPVAMDLAEASRKDAESRRQK